jgi:hypothetical protein
MTLIGAFTVEHSAGDGAVPGFEGTRKPSAFSISLVTIRFAFPESMDLTATAWV